LSNPKWLVIAKNEYRISTSVMGSLRRHFPLIAGGALVAWVFYLSPMLVQSLVGEFQEMMVSQVAVALFEIIMFIFSIFLVLLPVSNALKEEGGVAQVELMLKAPVRPGDVLMGEFMGKAPMYAVYATLATGFFTALLKPLGLSVVQTVVIILMAFVTCLGSFWVGTVLAAVSRTTLGRTAKGKDIGKAAAFIMVLPMVAVFYMMMNGNIFTLLLDPGTNGLVKALLGLFPSSWAAEVIVAFARNPGDIGAVWMLTVTRVGGMLAFMAATLAIGWKITDRAYSLEPANVGVTVVGRDGFLLRAARLLGGGGSFGVLLVSSLKDYTRRMENLSQIGYVVGLLVVMNFTFVDDAGGAQMMGMLMATVMALFLCAETTIRGREALFIYRKTPGGVARLMKAKLLQAWLFVVPVMVAIWAYSAWRFDLGFSVPFLMEMGNALLIGMANSAMAMGLSFANPAFHQKSGAYMINFQMIAFMAMGAMIIPDIFLDMPWLHMPIAWVMGVVLLFAGYRKLSTME
jgi:hypothetical protein